MSVTYGFYNSLNGDRKYNATQMSRIFDGIIEDGVFMNVGSSMMVTAGPTMSVNVGVGRAWFDHTWTYVDAIEPLEIPLAELVLNRIDAVVLDVNRNIDARKNSLKVIKGVPATNPERPTMIDAEQHRQYPLAYIAVNKGVVEIRQSDITNMVGTSVTPFVTGVLQGMSIDSLVAQWGSEFVTWFQGLQDTLDGDTAGNLLTMIQKHESSTTPHIHYGVAVGENDKSISIDLLVPLPEYQEGMGVCFKNLESNQGPVTININGLGPEEVVKGNGLSLSPGNLKKDSVYTVRYNGVNFILQGEGGEYGTALVGDVLSGKTIGTEDGLITGNMPNRGSRTFTPSGSAQTGAAGYYSSISVAARPTLSGNATVAQTLTGRTFYTNTYTRLTGTMPNRGAPAQTLTTQNGQYNIPAGYFSGGSVKATFANLSAGNIRSGVNVGGVVGSYKGSAIKTLSFSSIQGIVGESTIPGELLGTFYMIGYTTGKSSEWGTPYTYYKAGSSSFTANSLTVTVTGNLVTTTMSSSPEQYYRNRCEGFFVYR